MSKMCIIAGCDEAIDPGSKLDTCKLCRASINSWNKRRPAEVVARRERLKKYDCRMATLVDDEGVKIKDLPKNVVSIGTARALRRG